MVGHRIRFQNPGGKSDRCDGEPGNRYRRLARRRADLLRQERGPGLTQQTCLNHVSMGSASTARKMLSPVMVGSAQGI